jgi:hypothetical protein
MEIASSASVLGAIIGITQVLKLCGLPTRFAPAVSLALGLSLSFIAIGVSPEATFAGIIAGLSAAGLWSSTRTTLAI